MTNETVRRVLAGHEVATTRIDTDRKHSGRVAAELADALGRDEEDRS